MNETKKIITGFLFVGMIGTYMGSLSMAYTGHAETIVLGGNPYSYTTDDTEGIRKYENTTVTAYCKSINYTSSSALTQCKGIVQGSDKALGAGWYPGSSATYTFTKGSVHKMKNSVISDGHKYARIHFRGNANSYYTILGFNWCAY